MHTHKVVKIIESCERGDIYAYLMVMDCPVQPVKCVVVKQKLTEGEEFDPHFSNVYVLGRFQPNISGYNNARELTKNYIY